MTGTPRVTTAISANRIQLWMRWLCLLLLAATLPAAAATFTARLDRDTVLLGDVANLSLSFEGGQPASAPPLPTIPGLQMISAGQSSAVNWVNGQMSSSVTYNFIVKPTQVGEFTLPAMSAKVGNETLASQPLKLKVVRAQTPAPGAPGEEPPLALLRVVLPKTEAFVGETIIIELQLLVRAGVQNISNPDLPFSVDGGNVGKFVQGQQRQTAIGSTAFTVVPLLVPVTVLKPGALQIGPLDGALVVTLPSRQRDPFDPFGMFNNGVQQRVILSAPAQTLTARALPEANRPATFSGAIGQFSMTFTAGPTNVAVGDPITLRVAIHGRGGLEAFSLPDQPAWREFKTYPATAKVETTGEFGLEGTKTFEQVVVPQNTEIKELPAFEFAYFDPERRSYQTLRQPPTPIVVRPGGSTPAPSISIATNPAAENPPPAQDIVHIKPRLGASVASQLPWIRQPWFLVLQTLPLLAFIGSVIWRKRAEAMNQNPQLRRQREVARLIDSGLHELQQHAARGNSDAFFNLTVRLMQEAMGERLNLPASAITEAVIDEHLRPRGASDTTTTALHELFRLCNQARYAPMQSAHELEAVIPKLKTALHGVQEVKG